MNNDYEARELKGPSMVRDDSLEVRSDQAEKRAKLLTQKLRDATATVSPEEVLEAKQLVGKDNLLELGVAESLRWAMKERRIR